MSQEWRWQFVGFESSSGWRPVQAWFDTLPDDDRYEILYLLNILSNATSKLWRRPEFDPLEGAGGISEIRVPELRSARGSVTYRIYGYFGPVSRQYCFLYGTDKKVRNDEEGKRIAKNRLDELQNGAARVHQLAVLRGSVVEIRDRTKSKDDVR
jgi:hypothetical protein